MASPSESQTKPFSVLFVCLGNICRSPAAEGVFRDLVKKRTLDSKFNIDSAGTINYHEVGFPQSRFVLSMFIGYRNKKMVKMQLELSTFIS